jgi:predicted extracellular nuclease
MSAKTKLFVALLLAICSISVVAVLAYPIYLPQIEKNPTVTPTATFTATATATKTPGITPTPTRTPTPKPGVFIENIVSAPTLEEYIEIKNTSSNSVSLDGWKIKEDANGLVYNFSDVSIGGGKTIRVYTRIGQDTSSALFWNRTEEVWKDNGDTAYLRDAENDIVDTYQY